jgi:adenylate kinase
MNVILLGPPGAGKGTQARRLQTVLHVPHIASGDIFRDISRQETPLAQKVRSYMDAGQLVPDDLTNELVLRRLDEPDAQEGFLLDGYPRTEPQAEELDGALAEEGRAVNAALLITVPSDVLIRRVEGRLICPNCHAIYNLETRPPRVPGICDVCGHVLERRPDQSPEVLRTRLEEYATQTKPLIEYYGERGILTTVDGSRPFNVVTAEIDAALGVTPSASETKGGVA